MVWILLGALAVAAVFAVVVFLFFYGQAVQEKASTSSVSGGAGDSATPDYRERLKEATEKKRAGDLDGAADLIGDVLSEWEANPPKFPNDSAPDGIGRDYPEAKVYTRWALYLQRADRPEEAERVFRMLIAGEYPYMEYVRQVGPEEDQVQEAKLRELVHVYDKYRLFLQREKRNDDAVYPGLLAMGADFLGFHMAAREAEMVRQKLERQDLQTDVSDTVSKLAEGTAFEDRAGRVETVVNEWVSNLPETDLDALEGAVRRVLGAQR